MQHVLLVSYYYNESIVGTMRNRHLCGFLRAKGISVDVCDGSDVNGFGQYKKKTRACIRKSKAQTVYISCGPFNYLLTAVVSAKWNRKKIIIDFRDPWSFNLNTKVPLFSLVGIKRIMVKQYIKFIERIVYLLCDRFIVCTEGMAGLYRELFSDSKKIEIVMNGYDFNPNNYLENQKKKDGVETFLCIGKFFRYSEPDAISVIDKIESRVGVFCEQANLIFYSEERDEIEKYFSNNKKNISYSIYERVPYASVLEAVASCDCGVIVIRSEDFDYGTKIFDFLGMGVPVLDIFNHGKAFYKKFSEYLVSADEPLFRYSPIEKYHRSNIWSEKLALFMEEGS